MRSDLADEPPVSPKLPRRRNFLGPVIAASFFSWRRLWLLGAGCVALALLIPAPALGQKLAGMGAISGSVLNNYNGEPLAGITVTLRGSTLAVVTGANGRFSLPEVPAGEHVVSFSKSGYQRAVIAEVKVLPGQTSPVEARLNPEFYDMDEYEILAQDLDERPEGVLLVERQQSINFVEAISAERFSQLAAGDAGEIITKVTGVSIVDGKTAVVRGLSDRYNLTVLNGGDLPSSDPYRKSVSLDLFPSEVIENVQVSKTFTPDLPGGFAGAHINIITKSFPADPFIKFGGGLAYNTQSTFNQNYLTSGGGSLDGIGIDDGTRALPAELQNLQPGELQSLVNVYSSTSRANNTPEAIALKREAAYQMDDYAHAFGSQQMGPTTAAPPFDQDFKFLFGQTVDLAGHPFGYFAGMNWERDYRSYEDGTRARYTPDQQPVADFSDARSVTEVNWSGLVNLAYELAKNHEVAFNFLYSQVGEDEARRLVGKIQTSGEDQFGDTNRLTYLNQLYYIERNLTSYQLTGTHELPGLNGFQVNWLAGLATTYQDEPDVRYFNLIYDETSGQVEVGQNYIPEPSLPTRYFRHLEDENLNGLLDLTQPFLDGRQLEWKLKAGLFTSQSSRSFTEETFSYRTPGPEVANPLAYPNQFLPLSPPPQETLNPGNRTNYVVFRELNQSFGNSFYDASQSINAYYGMLEVPLLETLRLAGGVRIETTRLEATAKAFTVPASPQTTSTIDQSDLLPALNLTWALRPDMNLRASYAETLARPTYREFAKTRSYDPFSGILVAGNPGLTMSSIRNYDARFEWFTPRGGLLSLGAFYKQIEAPIEVINGEYSGDGELNLGGNVLTFFNGPPATIYGIEFEARQNLGVLRPSLAEFSVGLNFAWIYSEVDNIALLRDIKEAGNFPDAVSRPLYDQSPYIINADVSYQSKWLGTRVTLVYYYAAERLYLITQGYDVYEQGTPQLDLVISQRLGKHWTLKFAAENLLNPEFIQSYAVNGHTDTTLIFSSYTRGITFGLSFTCEF